MSETSQFFPEKPYAGTQINVLDHGYIRLVDYMGSDLSLIRAARASFNASWRTGANEANDDRLLERLWTGGPLGTPHGPSPKHSTPFEAVAATFEVKAPLFVFRQWHRHRTQCLDGATKIRCVSPNGRPVSRTIQQLFESKHGINAGALPAFHKNGHDTTGRAAVRPAVRRDPLRTRILPNCQERTLRTFDEESGEFRAGQMRDVWESGVKEIWELSTSRGFIRGSAKHPFLTRSGWVHLGDLRAGDHVAAAGVVSKHNRPIPPSLRRGIGVWTTMMRHRLIHEEDRCHICQGIFSFDDLQLDHVVPVAENLELALVATNLKPACYECHRKKTDGERPSRVGQSGLGLVWARVIANPSRVGEGMTYDIEMIGPDHNYVANGLVVHNSYNELSLRYKEHPDDDYYTPAVVVVGTQATENKQGRTTGLTAVEQQRELELMQYRTQCAGAFATYHELLGAGWPRELARCVLPVSVYSQMFTTANLLNFMRFLTLRADGHAQYEIRVYAEAMTTLLDLVVPRAMVHWKRGNGQ